jgi:hypothetical protein
VRWAARRAADEDTADGIEEFVLEPGEAFDFGLYVNAGDTSTSATINMDIVADATVVPDSYTGDSS